MSTPPSPQHQAADDAAPSNRVARRRQDRDARKGRAADPAAAAVSYRGSAGQPGPARTTAQGRRINPVRRTG